MNTTFSFKKIVIANTVKLLLNSTPLPWPLPGLGALYRSVRAGVIVASSLNPVGLAANELAADSGGGLGGCF